MRVSFSQILDAQTRYYHAGDGAGESVLLLHGVGMSADSWLPSVAALGRSFCVCAPDLLDNGFTASGRYEGGPPQPAIVDHLLALADHLKLDRFSVVGSSLGCAIATLLYLRAPERIKKIAFIGPGAVIDTPEALGQVLNAAAVNGRSALDNPTYESCRARLRRVFHDGSKVPDWLVTIQMTIYALPGALAGFDRRMAGLCSAEALSTYEVHSKLADVAAPALVILGREDPRGDYARTAAAASRLPQGRILTYEHCGHWPHMEYPERFASDLAAFLAAPHSQGTAS